MVGLTVLFLTLAAATDGAKALIPVPSGTEVWLQEMLSDQVAGMGLVQRYRFVMPVLADQVPPVDDVDGQDYMPDVLPDELTDEDMAALNDGTFGGTLSGDIDGDDPGLDVRRPDVPALEDHADVGDGALIPESYFDIPVPALPPGSEAAADADIAVPVAPDILMQDPNHKDIVWLCEHYILPRIKDLPRRPQQIVISLASAGSPFGTFDPSVVQLFEGFALPADRDACLWEPW